MHQDRTTFLSVLSVRSLNLQWISWSSLSLVFRQVWCLPRWVWPERCGTPGSDAPAGCWCISLCCSPSQESYRCPPAVCPGNSAETGEDTLGRRHDTQLDITKGCCVFPEEPLLSFSLPVYELLSVSTFLLYSLDNCDYSETVLQLMIIVDLDLTARYFLL